MLCKNTAFRTNLNSINYRFKQFIITCAVINSQTHAKSVNLFQNGDFSFLNF
jgi:hypothetical protein